jgi:hypothetical protein
MNPLLGGDAALLRGERAERMEKILYCEHLFAFNTAEHIFCVMDKPACSDCEDCPIRISQEDIPSGTRELWKQYRAQAQASYYRLMHPERVRQEGRIGRRRE